MNEWGRMPSTITDDTDNDDRPWTPRIWPLDPRERRYTPPSDDEAVLTNKIVNRVLGQQANKEDIKREIRQEIRAHTEETDMRRLRHIKNQIEALTQEKCYLEGKLHRARMRTKTRIRDE